MPATPLTLTTAKAYTSGSKVRYAGNGSTPGKPQVLTLTRNGNTITLADGKGGSIITLTSRSRAWLGATTLNALPAQTIAAKPAPKPRAKATAKPSRRNAKPQHISSPTGLSQEALSARAIKAAASRAAAKADPAFIPPSRQGSALPANHPHRIRAAKAAASRAAKLADPTYIAPSNMPRCANRHEAALQAWATRRATQQAAATANAKAARAAKRNAKATTTASAATATRKRTAKAA